MKKLNTIFSIIEKEKIILEEIQINFSDSKGIYLKIPDIPPTICVDKSILSYSYIYISILAEELGHHFTTNGDLTVKSKNYSEQLYKNKKERLAKIWGTNFLISDDEFVQALNNCISTIDEMAEYFHVTREVIHYKISSIISNELKYINIRNNFMTREIPYNSCAI